MATEDLVVRSVHRVSLGDLAIITEDGDVQIVGYQVVVWLEG